jgi:hypothetical protein
MAASFRETDGRGLMDHRRTISLPIAVK